MPGKPGGTHADRLSRLHALVNGSNQKLSIQGAKAPVPLRVAPLYCGSRPARFTVIICEVGMPSVEALKLPSCGNSFTRNRVKPTRVSIVTRELNAWVLVNVMFWLKASR